MASLNESETSPCDGCGLCCMHMSIPPYDDEEREQLQQELPKVYCDLVAVEATRELQWKSTGVEEVPCGFFDPVTRRCRHHENKPFVCHRFEVGDVFCLEFRADVGLPPVPYVPSFP